MGSDQGGPDDQRLDRGFRVALGAATLAILAVGVRAAAGGWWPIGDDGFFALRAQDVLSDHPPLLGTASTVSDAATGTYLHHPGPLQFYVLALPVAVLGPAAGVTVGTAAVNAAAVAAAGLLVRRTVGVLAGLATLAGLALLAWAMGSVYLHSPYGPTAVILPFALYLVAVACTATGELRALPVAVVAGSFVLQTHLSYMLLVPLLGLLAVGGLVLHLRRERGGDRGHRPGRPWPWLAGSGVLLVACWAPPLWQQLRDGRQGNLTGLLEAGGAGDQPSPGLGSALAAVARRVATPTLWLPPDFDRPDDGVLLIDVFPSWPAALLLLGAVVAPLVLAVRSGRQRGDRAVVAAAVTALAALAVSYVSVLNAPVLGVWGGNYIRFLWPVSLWVWLSLALAAARAWSGRLPVGSRHRAAVGAVVLCVVAGLLTLPVADRAGRYRTGSQATAGAVVDAVRGSVDGQEPVLLSYTRSFSFWNFAPVVMAELADAGVPFVVDSRGIGRQVGPDRYRTAGQLAEDPPPVAVVLVDSGRQRPPGGRLSARIPVDSDRRGWDGVDVYVIDRSADPPDLGDAGPTLPAA